MTDRSLGILDDIKVVEFAQNVAIPHCGRLLAAMGADVVKVEPPGGDAMRKLGHLTDDEGRTYAAANPGKRSIVLDLQSEHARQVVNALFAWADVALVAFKGSDLERYGLDWDHARTVNPSLIHLTHTAFGPEGPDAEQGGYDVLAQATSGIGFYMNRSKNGVPVATRPAINDMGTGIYSALGVVAAIRHRDRTGEGQRVDTSLLGTAVSFGMPVLAFFPDLDTGRSAEIEARVAEMMEEGQTFDEVRAYYETMATGGHAMFQIYFRVYRTTDGMMAVAALSQGLQAKFHEVTGVDGPSDIRPGSPEVDSVVAKMEALFITRTTADWMERLRQRGVPCAVYNLPFEVADDPQVKANEFMVELEHPTIGRYVTTGMPIRFEATPAPIDRPSPQLGIHTGQVMSEIGLDQEQQDRLTDLGVIGPDRA